MVSVAVLAPEAEALVETAAAAAGLRAVCVRGGAAELFWGVAAVEIVSAMTAAMEMLDEASIRICASLGSCWGKTRADEQCTRPAHLYAHRELFMRGFFYLGVGRRRAGGVHIRAE